MTIIDKEPSTRPDPSLASVVEQLRAERDGLLLAMRSRSLIEQAKGILMGRDGVTAEVAFARLRETSQRSNVKLARVAADLIARHVPPPAPRPATGRAVGRRAPVGSAPGDASTRAPAPAAETVPHAHYLLLTARLDAAVDQDDVVAALAETTGGWPVPGSVVLALTEPDGALRVAASRGLTSELASQWHRVPPQVDVPLTTAVRTGEPVWLADPTRVRQAYPLLARMSPGVGASATLPLGDGARLLGALGFAWREPVAFDESRRSYLTAVAAAVARTVLRLTPAGGTDPTWVQALLDGALTAAAVLSPCGAAGEPVDFRYEQVNALAEAAAGRRGRRLTGVTLLTLLPDLGARVLLPLCRAVLADGRSRQLDDLVVPGSGRGPDTRVTVRVTRLDGRVLVAWRRQAPGELMHDDLVAAGRAAGVAAFRWHLPSGELLGTDNLRELIGWPAGPAPTPRSVLQAVDAVHRPAVRTAALASLRHGVPMELTVRTGRRWLRVAAERTVDGGRVVALRGRLQDVTELRAARSRDHRPADVRAVRRSPIQSEP